MIYQVRRLPVVSFPKPRQGSSRPDSVLQAQCLPEVSVT